jgi:large subunit ribosomal protein L35
MPRAYKGKKKAKTKLKSNRGAAKRFRKMAKKGFKCKSTNRNHILTKKTTKRKRRLRAGLMVREEDLGRVEQMLPYA